MRIGAVADLHGNFDALSRAMLRHAEVRLWICVGDVASITGAYPEPRAAMYWIKGNNEQFDRIAGWEAGLPQPPHMHYIRNGTSAQVGPLVVAGVGGTYAPTWFDTPASQLPAKPSDDKRRHFVREDVEACTRLPAVDILMTHEAPRPFIVVPEAARAPVKRRDAGKPVINDLLATLKPRLHLCGHHHRFAEATREGVRSVCIDRINRSYLLIDAVTLAYEKIEQ